MRTLLLLISINFLLISCNTSKIYDNNANLKRIYTYEEVEVKPQFKSGDASFKTFIKDNLIYPEISKKNNIEGVVYIQFIVEKNGKISNIRVLKGLDKHCDESSISLIGSMPKWIAGKVSNKTVRTAFNLPIRFSLK